MTPRSYLAFLAGYRQLYSRKREAAEQLAASIQGGLRKMGEAKEDVRRLKAELAVKDAELAVAGREAEALLASISESTAVAEKEKLKVFVCYIWLLLLLFLLRGGRVLPACKFWGLGLTDGAAVAPTRPLLSCVC